ncbi:MAG TPA: HEAT repeat domain-containing protein [Draconibacterium sp.]|nr:HEAT repeat domain-containing protein [Draconibacterium sp.]
MKNSVTIVTIALLVFLSLNIRAQSQQARIDSLVMKMRTAGREWNDYANPLIEIGEPAVPLLIKNATDASLSQWNRRILMTTLNNIHSEQWVKPALKILFDYNETPEMRNRVTGGLSGYDLSQVNEELWLLFNSVENQFHKSNLANLLVNSDTALAYKAFCELYQTQDGHIQRNALQNLVLLRPHESISWYLDAIQGEDWMTANLAMDSLIRSALFEAGSFMSLYNLPGVSEEVQWRVIFVLGQRSDSAYAAFFCEAMESKSWLVRTESAIALSKLNKETVLKQVSGLQNSSTTTVRNNARWVVLHLTDKY